MESWKVEDTVRLAEILAPLGVDLLDVSSGGLHPKQKVKAGPGYQAPFAKAVKERLGDKLAVGTVGTITNGKQANTLLEEGLDLAICGRMFQKNPALVWHFAEDLGVQVCNCCSTFLPLTKDHLKVFKRHGILLYAAFSSCFLIDKTFRDAEQGKLTRTYSLDQRCESDSLGLRGQTRRAQNQREDVIDEG